MEQELLKQSDEASFNYCTSTVLAYEGMIISEDLRGQSFCYQTNLGLPGMLKLIQVQPTDQFIEILFVTWVAP